MPGTDGDVFAVGGQDNDGEAGDADGVAGMNDAPRFALDGLEVRGVIVTRDVGVFAVFAVVEELADLDALHEIRHAAHVVRMEVRDEHLVELGNAGIVHGGHDAVGIAAVVARPACIDEQRSAGGGDEQRGLAAFNIDGVDEQVLCSGLRCGAERRREQRVRQRRMSGRTGK